MIDNVSRCQQLMNDFRKENYIKAWKDDVLQLYNVMWYVFFSLPLPHAPAIFGMATVD